MHICHVCGNEIKGATRICPFCGSENDDVAQAGKNEYIHRIVNLERGRPSLEAALQRLDRAIADGLQTGVAVLTLIHGYGSSGKGGVIRTECRKSLDFMKSQKRIFAYIPGEEFSKRSGLVKTILRRYPRLSSDKNLNKGNRGITLVIF